jgi:hypothetical protein
MKRKDIDPAEIERRIQNANAAFPDAQVENYEALIPGLNLPDKADNHVLAAAIKTNANVIVTNNLKHFPEDYLAEFGLYAKGPDDFLTDIIDLNPEKAVESFMNLVRNKTNPPLSEFDVLDRLRSIGLTDTANYLHSQL